MDLTAGAGSGHSTAPRLRVAIVGCGRIGTFTAPEVRRLLSPGWLPLNHAEAIAANDRLELVALCDTLPENLERAGRMHGCSRRYADYRALIAEEKPDILAVATRTPGRCDIIEYAAERGVRGMHVEKPLGTNMRDVRRALEAVRAHGVWLTYGTTRRFMDAYREARAIVRRGDIGTLEQIIVQNGKGQLLWTHPHSADLLVFYAGDTELRSVQAECEDAVAFAGSPLLVDADPLVDSAFVRFANGVTGLITSAGGNGIELCGNRGIVTVGADGAWLEMHRCERDEDLYPTAMWRSTPRPEKSGTQRAFEELAMAVQGGTAPSISLEEIGASQSILLLIAWSSMHGGRVVRPAELLDDFTVSGRFKGNLA